MQSNLYKYFGAISSKKIIFSNFGSRSLLASLLLSFLLLSCLTVEIDATSTYYNNNEMWVQGYLHYVGSSRGTVNDNLDDGQVHRIYLNAEAERCLAREPYLTNMALEVVEGWIDDGYECSIPYSQRLNVEQPHTYNNQSNYNATAYYDVEVVAMQTNLLYRPERNDKYITLIVSGLVIMTMWCVIKVVRHD